MKKFVSIVIALVMVLSMTSAFAITNCEIGSFGWDCPTEITACGKGAVEVVPYVKANAACDSWEYVVSDCASAILSEKVFFAVKLTVEANPNEDWWKASKVVVEEKGIKAAAAGTYVTVGVAGIDLESDEEEVYYLLKTKAGYSWINEEADNFDLNKVVFAAEVTDADKAKVCAELSSYDNGQGTYEWGDYVIEVAVTENADKTLSGYIYITGDYGKASYNVVKGEIAAVAGDKKAVEDANATFNLGCGWVCVTADALVANFGWDFEQEDCFDWSEVGATTVNPECSVEIPKTGDVSVVAYAVMAVVAAAGTMLKK